MSDKHYEGKPCVRCGSTERNTKSGRCARCSRAKSLARRNTNPEEYRERASAWKRANPSSHTKHWRDAQYRKKYGITLSQYEDMLEKQGGVCAICGEKCSFGRELAVDHCHSTGVVRGLLCGHCNHGLGKFRDSPSLLVTAISYLEKYRGPQATPDTEEAG